MPINNSNMHRISAASNLGFSFGSNVWLGARQHMYPWKVCITPLKSLKSNYKPVQHAIWNYSNGLCNSCIWILKWESPNRHLARSTKLEAPTEAQIEVQMSVQWMICAVLFETPQKNLGVENLMGSNVYTHQLHMCDMVLQQFLLCGGWEAYLGGSWSV